MARSAGWRERLIFSIIPPFRSKGEWREEVSHVSVIQFAVVFRPFGASFVPLRTRGFRATVYFFDASRLEHPPRSREKPCACAITRAA